MAEHLKDMIEVTDKLADIGSTVALEDQVLIPLASYSMIVTTLEVHVDNLDVSSVQQVLLNEELKRNDSNTTSVNSLDNNHAALVGAQ